MLSRPLRRASELNTSPVVRGISTFRDSGEKTVLPVTSMFPTVYCGPSTMGTMMVALRLGGGLLAFLSALACFLASFSSRFWRFFSDSSGGGSLGGGGSSFFLSFLESFWVNSTMGVLRIRSSRPLAR